MDIDAPTPLLGGLTPTRFMRRHWHKQPLLVRGALDAGRIPIDRRTLAALAAEEAVEARLVTREAGDRWRLRHGPIRRLPAASRRGWTLLVQGVDLHLEAGRALLDRFRFVPDARLDDLMVSLASEGGGVGPHVDSYDVFLLQLAGRRHWRIARAARRPALRDDVPLKMLQGFEAEAEWTLAPGDMLYLPPGWAHDGVARGSGACLTASIGFRAPARARLARELLGAWLDAAEAPAASDRLYRDAMQAATPAPARIPPALGAFAREAVRRALAGPAAIDLALGEVLSEPKPGVVFEPAGDASAARGLEGGVRLDRRSRMLYDDGGRVYLNGQSYRASGRDATLLRALADGRMLEAAQVRRLGAEARTLMQDWLDGGWLQPATRPQTTTEEGEHGHGP